MRTGLRGPTRRNQSRFEPRFPLEEYNSYPAENDSIEHRGHPTAFDILSKFVLPIALAINAYFIRAHPYLVALFAGVALLVIFYHPMAERVKSRLDSAHDREVARNNIKQLRKFSKEAGDFFDPSTSRSDSVPGVLQELTNRNNAAGNAIRIAPFIIFQEHWKFLHDRVEHDDLNPTAFHHAARELTSLLQAYNSYCVYPIFYLFAAELREVLLPNEKSKLNAFQQRYVAFADAYSKYIIQVGEEFRTLPRLNAGMALPAPL